MSRTTVGLFELGFAAEGVRILRVPINTGTLDTPEARRA
jgi:hypothetical protein